MSLQYDKVFIFKGDSIVIPEETPESMFHEEISVNLIESAFPDAKNLDSFTFPSLEDGRGYVSFISLNDVELPKGWKAVPVRMALLAITGGTMALGSGITGRILRSYHLSLWRKESRFCGGCGAPNKDADTGELARQCTKCGRIEYPRISPAVIVLVTNDKGEALLAHNSKFASGMYSLLAGFTETGESLEETIKREIKEEVNINVKDIRYLCSQPWPFPNSLMLGFTARYDGGELRPDGVEIEDVRWFSRDSLPGLPGSASISRHIINLWLNDKL